MRLISVARLKAFWEEPAHRDAEQPLRAWVSVVKAARWTDHLRSSRHGGRSSGRAGGDRAAYESRSQYAAGDRLDILATLVERYEAEHTPILPPDPIEAILFIMEQRQLSRRDLEPAIGSRARVAEVLNRRRGLTLAMIRALSSLLHIPADVLIQPSAIGTPPRRSATAA